MPILVSSQRGPVALVPASRIDPGRVLRRGVQEVLILPSAVLWTHVALAAMTAQAQSGLPLQAISMAAEGGAPQFSVGVDR